MALEQLSIVLGVVFGFWTGFATRSSKLHPGFTHQPRNLTIVSWEFSFLAHPARNSNIPGNCPSYRVYLPPAFPPTSGAPRPKRRSTGKSRKAPPPNSRGGGVRSLAASMSPYVSSLTIVNPTETLCVVLRLSCWRCEWRLYLSDKPWVRTKRRMDFKLKSKHGDVSSSINIETGR